MRIYDSVQLDATWLMSTVHPQTTMLQPESCYSYIHTGDWMLDTVVQVLSVGR